MAAYQTADPQVPKSRNCLEATLYLLKKQSCCCSHKRKVMGSSPLWYTFLQKFVKRCSTFGVPSTPKKYTKMVVHPVVHLFTYTPILCSLHSTVSFVSCFFCSSLLGQSFVRIGQDWVSHALVFSLEQGMLQIDLILECHLLYSTYQLSIITPGADQTSLVKAEVFTMIRIHIIIRISLQQLHFFLSRQKFNRHILFQNFFPSSYSSS